MSLYSDADAKRRNGAPTVSERLNKYIKKPSKPGGCWQWTGSCGSGGYGHIKVNDIWRTAHIVSWELATGKTKPVGSQLDHKCVNRLCVNPAHLEVVSPSENMKRTGYRKRGEMKVMGKSLPDRVLIEKAEVNFEVPISKIDDEQRIAFGWASVSITKAGEIVVDRQEDVIDNSDLEVAVYDYVENSRDAGEMHVRKGIGSLVESIVFTPEKIAALGLPEGSIQQGWWTGYRVNDDAVWAGIKSGVYPMLSVHGSAKREAI